MNKVKRSAEGHEEEHARATKKHRTESMSSSHKSRLGQNEHCTSSVELNDSGLVAENTFSISLGMGQVEEEWKRLDEEARSVHLLPHNPNDRFADIVPVRDTLCALTCGTYINANRVHIEGLSFIATQEPLRNPEQDLGYVETESHFWSLVWSEKVAIILSLTSNDVQYLPKQTQAYGQYVITPQDDKWIADYPIRVRHYNIQPETNEGEETHNVVHIHFQAWPDRDIPYVSNVIYLCSLLKYYQHKMKSTEVLCHCSAGVGRTGTFLAVWTLMETKKWNVLEVVQELRRQRHHQMVQTKDQYKFIYHCLVTSRLKESKEESVLSRIVNDSDVMNRLLQDPGLRCAFLGVVWKEFPDVLLEEVSRRN